MTKIHSYKVLTALPAVLAVGHRGLLPEDWDDLMKALVSTDKITSITGGNEQQGIAAAFATLRSNEFQSYLWTAEAPIGVKRAALSEKFCKESMAEFRPNMSIGTAICLRGTDNYDFHEEYFGTILNRALKKRKETGRESFDKITAEFPKATTNQRKRST